MLRCWHGPSKWILLLGRMRIQCADVQAINGFCRELGVTRSEGGVHFHKLEHAVCTAAATNPSSDPS